MSDETQPETQPETETVDPGARTRLTYPGLEGVVISVNRWQRLRYEGDGWIPAPDLPTPEQPAPAADGPAPAVDVTKDPEAPAAPDSGTAATPAPATPAVGTDAPKE